jgi:acetate kinase
MGEERIQAIVAINSGSSTLKFGLFSWTDPSKNILKGKITGIGTADCFLTVTNAEGGGSHCDPTDAGTIEQAAQLIVQWLHQHSGLYKINGIGHRVVHGGLQFLSPQLIDDNLLSKLKELESLAPLHLPDALSVISITREAFPTVVQTASFDTNFHRMMPFEARHYALPRSLWTEGVVRYGFHGISCEYIYERLQRIAGNLYDKKIIIAHLGSGSSLTAVKNGISIENTMGFTPAGGLIMNTRAGDIDPGVISYLIRTKNMDANQLDQLLNKKSGLKAIAASANTIEQLQKEEKTDSKAAEAILMYCYSIKKQIGALAAVLGGVDMIVFTGGIGENAPAIRKQICKGLEFLDVRLNATLNNSSPECINEHDGKVRIYVIRTNEEMIIAKQVKEIHNIIKPDHNV